MSTTATEPTEKIAAHHLERSAYVYIRQSTPRQVQQHRESQINQNALVERAVALGWAPTQVHVIDADLGQSGQNRERAGFHELVAEVSLGRVGIVLAYEASRLARNNADWYTLVDLATVVGTLLADTEGVYDPRLYNDRLLLGLRGMLSEAELHLLRLRMDAGRLRQVERGSLRQTLPTGYVREADGRVSRDPDQQVQHAIALVFERFARLGSASQVRRSLSADGVLLPRRQRGGLPTGETVWRRPSYEAIYEILRNPTYAGAFVYGRTGPRADQVVGPPGLPATAGREAWTTIHQDRYPAYISWDQFMANHARLADNSQRYAQHARGAPRQGSALLVGLVVCGGCQRHMRVTYRAHPRYVCQAMLKAYGDRTCQSLAAAEVDAAVVGAFFEAIAPAELTLLDEVLAARRAEWAQLAQQQAEQVRRAEYEAQLAERQYRAVDPENRLVAAELERRWEAALQARAEARVAAERVTAGPTEPELDPILRAQLHALNEELPTLWASGTLRPDQQKALLRSLIRRVVLSRPSSEAVEVRIVWVSGAVTPLVVHPAIYSAADLPQHAQFVTRLSALSAEGYSDPEIARRLTAEGFRSARSNTVPVHLVIRQRLRYGIVPLLTQFRQNEKVAGQWTVGGLARALGVERAWVLARIARGELPATRHPTVRQYLIPDDPGLIEQLRAHVRETL